MIYDPLCQKEKDMERMNVNTKVMAIAGPVMEEVEQMEKQFRQVTR
jgi:hypothetical protein